MECFFFFFNKFVENAVFYIDNKDGCHVDETYGLYCGGPSAISYDVTFRNCTIGNPNADEQSYQSAVTSQRNYNYMPAENINFYDCNIYMGHLNMLTYGSITSGSTDSRLINSSFNIYGDTHFYKADGSEFTKDEITEDIASWKTTVKDYGNGTYSANCVGSEDKFIETYLANADTSIGEIKFFRLTDNSNVYDYC